MISLNSYISFNGNAREAVEYYKSIFGGEATVDTFSSFVDSMPVTPEDADKIMHAHIKGDNGIELMLADTPTGMNYDEGMRISLTLSGDDEATLTEYWQKLSGDGTVTMPLEKSPWGDMFGMLKDKFGVDWMININSVNIS